mgnify:CR=1 FL=1
MLTQERHLQILAQLEEKGTVSVAQLTQLLGASESTVRRDLIALDRLGTEMCIRDRCMAAPL